MPSLIVDLLGRLDSERRYDFDERAGAIEFGSGVDRDQAEVLALVDLLRAHPAALVGITALEVDGLGYVVTTDVNAARDRFDGAIREVVDLADVINNKFGGLALLRSTHDN